MIDVDEAKRLARVFVGAEAELALCTEPPDGLYLARPPDVGFYFFVYRPSQWRVGGSEVIVVDRATGEVRHAGLSGE